MRSRWTTLLSLALLTVAVAACGSDSSGSAATSPGTATPTVGSADPRRVVLTYVAEGGCQMMGPNCPTYVVHADGTINITRTGNPELPGAEASVPAGLVEAWTTAIADMDLDALVARLRPGTCQKCVDGIDLVVTVATPRGDVVLDSTVVEFDEREPFFQALDVLMTDVTAAGGLDIVQR